MSKEDEPLPSQTLADATTEELADALEAIDGLVGKVKRTDAALAMARLWIEGELRRRGGDA